MLFDYLHLNLNPVTQFRFDRSHSDILDEAEFAISELVKAMELDHYLFVNVSLATRMTFGSYPEIWTRLYRESRFVVRDPVAQYSIRGHEQPLLWSECPFVPGTDALPLNLARQYLGVSDGLIFPGKFQFCLSLSGDLPQSRMIQLKKMVGPTLQEFVARLSLIAAADSGFSQKMDSNLKFFRLLKQHHFRKA